MQPASRRSGRISFVAIAGICSLALVGFLMLSTGKSARTCAGEFMTALARADINKLTETSVVQNESKDQIRKEWEQTMKYGRNYVFFWTIDGVDESKDVATVRLGMTKNPLSPSAYPEHYELQLKKVNGEWQVDVTQISREMFPFLPQ
jgi:hypothetical protein